MNTLFDWDRYNRFNFALSLPLRIDCESTLSLDFIVSTKQLHVVSSAYIISRINRSTIK